MTTPNINELSKSEILQFGNKDTPLPNYRIPRVAKFSSDNIEMIKQQATLIELLEASGFEARINKNPTTVAYCASGQQLAGLYLYLYGYKIWMIQGKNWVICDESKPINLIAEPPQRNVTGLHQAVNYMLAILDLPAIDFSLIFPYDNSVVMSEGFVFPYKMPF